VTRCFDTPRASESLRTRGFTRWANVSARKAIRRWRRQRRRSPYGLSAAGSPIDGLPGRSRLRGLESFSVDVPDLNDWQLAVYNEILERGPLTMHQVVAATALPAKEVRPLLAQLEQARLILRREDGWYAP
jgi:predicted Rossmann fold nucleotide-binding protein DprA/Smf involved in DNA uptake